MCLGVTIWQGALEGSELPPPTRCLEVGASKVIAPIGTKWT